MMKTPPQGLSLNTLAVGVKTALNIEHLRQFAQGHAVSQRNRVKGREAALAAINRAFDTDAVDRVHAVEHDESQALFARGFEAIAHRGDVRIEAATDVLNVKHECVEILQLCRFGRAPGAVKTVNRQAGFFAGAVAHIFIERAANAVFGTE